ncbi:MAG: hypothetical protein ACRCT8_16690 [Lacipirellulaceae bacterium]
MVELLRSLRDDFVSSSSGPPSERLPAITPDMEVGDLIAAAEVLSATVLGFLSPDEAEEQRDTFGFHAIR